jgi:hypothetical protein
MSDDRATCSFKEPMSPHVALGGCSLRVGSCGAMKPNGELTRDMRLSNKTRQDCESDLIPRRPIIGT